jgi:hypothetical protein
MSISHFDPNVDSAMFDLGPRCAADPTPSRRRTESATCTTAFLQCAFLRRNCRRRNKAELPQHCQLVKHQIKRDMFAISKAEHLDIVHFDGAACRRNVPHRTVKNPALRPPEYAFLDCDVVDDVNGLDFDTRIREGSEPTAEECDARRR